MMQTFTTGAHEAVLDPLAGAGVLVAPLVLNDVSMGGPEGLHAADWTSCVRRLFKAGWTLLENDLEEVATIAHLEDGRKVHALYPSHAETLTPSEDRDYSLALARLLADFADAERLTS